MQITMSVDDIITTPKPVKKRHIGRWVSFILLALTVITVILWTNRYALLEDWAKEALLEQGIDGELSIDRLTKTGADIKSVKLSADGKTFFSADKIAVEYAWREALKGDMQRLVFVRPRAQITIDEKGKIIDGWLPPTSDESSSGSTIPQRGIKIEQGTFNIVSPYGHLSIDANADILAKDNITADLDIAPGRFSYQDYKLEGGGKLDIIRQGQTNDVTAEIKLSSIFHPVITASNVTIKGRVKPDIDTQRLALVGDVDIGFGSIDSAHAKAETGAISWQGGVSHDKDKTHPLAALGTWRANVEGVTMTDPVRRRDIVRKLTLSDALLATPIAENFSGELTAIIADILLGNNAEGSGHIDLNQEGLTVSLQDTAYFKSSKTTMTVSPRPERPIYNYRRNGDGLDLHFNAALTRPAGLAVQDAYIHAIAENGWRLTGIESFTGHISTAKTWRKTTPDGLPVRLAPFKAKAAYDSQADIRYLQLEGNVDYDGPLPAGYATGLLTKGRMDMVIDAPALAVSYAPNNGDPITLRRFDTDTEWRGEDISAILVPATPLYTRNGNKARLTAKLKDTALIAIDNADARHLGMTFKDLDVDGTLTDERQNWEITAETAKICSEDMPGPGTDIRMPQAHLSVLNEAGEIRFNMDSRAATAKTQLVYANDLAIQASGSPAHYTLHYHPGTDDSHVKFIGDAIPKLPMTGFVTYKNETFEGTAKTQFPLTDNTPIDIAYRFKNGAGTADVVIPELSFEPNGLQPQYLVSALKGKIADVDGLVSANIKLGFAAGQPLRSSGTVKITDMNFGTLPGPLTGVNTELQFSNMFPLQSEGRQTLTVDNFDPGFPLQNGAIEFALIPDGVKVYSARWPLGAGFFSLDPFDWLYTAPQNRVVMRIEKVSLGEFLKDFGNGSLKATGDIEGTLPIVLAGIDVKVEKGELYVKDGGVIQYQSQQINSVSDFPDTDVKAVAAIRDHRYRDAVFEALKDFRYKELTAKIDGPLDGAIDVGMVFEGKNKDVLAGQPFLFDINLQGELLNILRSFDTNAQIKSELSRRNLLQEEF